ncbi:TPA: hypothetical protein HA251_00805 [Candidatus Woesearchaeota archaeon]|nr:hypothetical protein [Candidatus Woesearchaeota archaeon]
MEIVYGISIIIKVTTLIMVLYTFKNLLAPSDPQPSIIYTQFYALKKKYSLLRFSLIFVAALIVLELASMIRAATVNMGAINDTQLLLSDAIFLGLIILLTHIYKYKRAFKDTKLG